MRCMVEGYRVAFIDIEDGYAKFILYKDEEIREDFHYPVNELPEGVKREHLDDQFRPEFDDEGNIVALHHDQELHNKNTKNIEK
jgi:hypothetical protein